MLFYLVSVISEFRAQACACETARDKQEELDTADSVADKHHERCESDDREKYHHAEAKDHAEVMHKCFLSRLVARLRCDALGSCLGCYGALGCAGVLTCPVWVGVLSHFTNCIISYCYIFVK